MRKSYIIELYEYNVDTDRENKCEYRLNAVDAYELRLVIKENPKAAGWKPKRSPCEAVRKERLADIRRRVDEELYADDVKKMFVPFVNVDASSGLLASMLKNRAKYVLMTNTVYLYESYEKAEKEALRFKRRFPRQYVGIYDMERVLEYFGCLDVYERLGKDNSALLSEEWVRKTKEMEETK